MTRSFFLLLALIALTTSAFTPPRTNDEEAVRAVIDQMITAFNAHDADAQAALYADGAQFFWGEGDIVTLDDRAGFLAQGRQWHAQVAALRLVPDGAPAIRFLDDDTATAFIAGTMTEHERPVGHVHVLLVLRKAASGWQIVAEHQAMLPSSEG